MHDPRRPVFVSPASVTVALAVGLALTPAAAARAADASAWSMDSRSAIRLIAGANKGGEAPLRAGVEIKLKPGWHTYWRYPGDSGVPPRFDFTGSENLKSATVLYPAPTLHNDDTGQTLVYEKGVIFPVLVAPRQTGKQVTLRLKVDYAVCEKLCVPAEGRAELTIAAGESGADAALKAAEARVPKQVTAAQASLSARRVTGGAKPLVMVDVATSGNAPLQLFVEGPTGDWALPIPKPAQGAPVGRRHFSFELDGLPPGIDPNSRLELTFTLVEGERAREVTTHLD